MSQSVLSAIEPPEAPEVTLVRGTSVTLRLPPDGPYDVWRHEDGGDWKRIAVGQAHDFTDDGLSLGTAYAYALTRNDGDGESARSDAAHATTAESDEEQPVVIDGLDLDDLNIDDPDVRDAAMELIRDGIGPMVADGLRDAMADAQPGERDDDGELLDEGETEEEPDPGNMDKWFLIAAAIVGAGAVLAGIIGAGGLKKFGDEAQKSTEDEVAEQLGHLDNLASEVGSGDAEALGAAMENRLGMYGDALGKVAEGVRYDEKVASDFKWARRILSEGADSCACCIDIADYGWMPIDDCPPIGTCECRINCLCEIEYSDADEMPEDDAEMSRNVALSFCPTGDGGGIDPTCSPGDADGKAESVLQAAKSFPGKILAAIKEKAAAKYAKLSERYGPKYAKVIIGAAILGLPLPVPGSSFLTAAPVIALAEMHRMFGKATMSVDEDMSEEFIQAAAAKLIEELTQEFEGAQYCALANG